jgi:hypothetical protein
VLAAYNPVMVDHPQLSQERIAEVRKITLPQGGELEVQMTPEFVAVLKQHYGLFGDQPLDDDHVRMYVWGSLNSAVDKAEREKKDDKPQDNTRGVRRPRH